MNKNLFYYQYALINVDFKLKLEISPLDSLEMPPNIKKNLNIILKNDIYLYI